MSSAEAGPILENHGPALTSYRAGGATSVQDIRPQHLQRGTNLEGTLRAGPFFAWALAGNPFGEGGGSPRLGDVALATGAYSPTEVDLALPAQGAGRWTIGRTFNAVQLTGAGASRDSNGPQGYNWHQASQPEIVLYDDPSDAAQDMVYLVYGADRFAEFKRTGALSTVFKGVNGAAGLVEHAAGSPDVYVYHDPNGARTSFFGGNTSSGRADWQLWKIVDAAGNTAYVGHETTAATAASSGYNPDGTMAVAYDDAGRRYCYSYSGSTIGGATRLVQVLVETDGGDGWDNCGEDTLVASVDYGYYEDDEEAHGQAGDLKLVTVTTPLSQSGVNLVRKTLYRYYDDTWDGQDGRRGSPHQLKMVVDAEGYRKFDWDQDAGLDDDALGAADSMLKPYAGTYLEYVSAGDRRVSSVFFSGECGCSGGNDGRYGLFYGTSSGYATDVADTTYQPAWGMRAVVAQPDGVYATSYMDETGQGLSRVVTDGDPGVGYTDWWATKVIRSGDGLVTAVHTPANASGYTHSTGVIASKTSADLVNVTDRVGGSGFDKGLAEAARYKEGDTGASVYFTGHSAYTSRGLSVGGVTLDRPLRSASRSYHTAGTSAGTSANYDETAYSYSWHNTVTATDVQYVAIKQITTTPPAVSTAKNGPGVLVPPITTERYLRADGTTAFTRDAAGSYTYTRYENGQLVKQIQDCRTDHATDFAGGDDPDTAFDIDETSAGLHLITSYTYDAQGRPETTTLPTGRVMRHYYDTLADGRPVTLSIPREVAGSPATYYGPVDYSVSNLGGKSELQGTVGISAGGITTALSGWIDGTLSNPIAALDVGTLERLGTTAHNSAGTRVEESRTYVSIPAAGSFPGARGTEFDAALTGYDDMGRVWRTEDQTGTITRTVYDDLGRVSARHTGTNDTSFGGGVVLGTDDMVQVEALVYDGGATGGNSHLTAATADPDGLWLNDNSPGNPDDRRITAYTYDYRGRMLLQTSPQSPHVFSKHDNLGRVVASGTFSATGGIVLGTDDPTTETASRLGLSQSFYDELGRVWKSQRHKVDLADGSDDDNLQTLTWYDAAGRVAKTRGERFTKTRYDGLGRATHHFTLSSSDDADYADAVAIDGDIVLEEHQSVYDTAGRMVMSAVISRLHNDFGAGETTGALDTNADGVALTLTAGDIEGRVQITATWYDAQDRFEASAFYGTNHATANAGTFDRAAAASVPSRSDTVLVTSSSYNTAGQTEEVTDPKGLVTRTLYDDAGRRTATVENYTGSSPTASSDRWTRFAYTDGLMTKQWADLDGDGTEDADDQVTTYEYEVRTDDTPGASLFASNRLLRRVIYPEQVALQADTDRDVWFAYNAQGEGIYTQDQTGTVIQTDYDTAGRQTHRRVTALGTGIDGAVERISLGYNSRGQVETVTQYDDPAVGSGSVVDQVSYTHSDWGPVSLFEQDHGAMGDAYAVALSYEKATGGRNTIRRTGQTLRHGASDQQVLTYGYLSSSGGDDLDDADTSRVTTVSIGSGTPVLVAEYRYLGAAQLVETDLAEPGVHSRVHDGAGTPAYPDLDSFNRITHNRWTKNLATDRDFYSVELAYDRNSNITHAVDNIHRDTSGDHIFDAAYTVDGLDRVTGVREGHWDGTQITTVNRLREELWDLSSTGNWLLRQLDLDGDGDFTDTGLGELADRGTFSNANELLTRDTNDSAPVEFTLGYNLRGDLTDDSEEYEYVYDAFGRLREVRRTDNQDLVAAYTYNGLGYRISWTYDTDASGDVDGWDMTLRFAYSDRWQLVATSWARNEGAGTEESGYFKEMWAYHNAGPSGLGSASYIDSVILRDKDTDTAWTDPADEAAEQRDYLLQNWRADVSVVINHNGSAIREWVKYSAYGVPQLLAWWDTNYDGARTSADLVVYGTLWNAALTTYDVRADTNLDGVVNGSDSSLNSSDWAAGNSTAGRGHLSRTDAATSVFNRIGYAGYQWDPVIGKYHVRNRVLDPELGRWSRRDPIGYVDGMSLYEYVAGRPVTSRDPSGRSQHGPDPVGAVYRYSADLASWAVPKVVGWAFSQSAGTIIEFSMGTEVNTGIAHYGASVGPFIEFNEKGELYNAGIIVQGAAQVGAGVHGGVAKGFEESFAFVGAGVGPVNVGVAIDDDGGKYYYIGPEIPLIIGELGAYTFFEMEKVDAFAGNAKEFAMKWGLRIAFSLAGALAGNGGEPVALP